MLQFWLKKFNSPGWWWKGCPVLQTTSEKLKDAVNDLQQSKNKQTHRQCDAKWQLVLPTRGKVHVTGIFWFQSLRKKACSYFEVRGKNSQEFIVVSTHPWESQSLLKTHWHSLGAFGKQDSESIHMHHKFKILSQTLHNRNRDVERLHILGFFLSVYPAFL